MANLTSKEETLLKALKYLARHYVGVLEHGRDRIIALGGTCDPVDVMERGDPHLRQVREVIASVEGSPSETKAQPIRWGGTDEELRQVLREFNEGKLTPERFEEWLKGSPEETSAPRCHFMAFRKLEFQCTKPAGHDGPHSCGLAPTTEPTEKASAPLPTCQHDLLKSNTTIEVDPKDPFHAWCTVCKHDFRTRAPLKNSGARCGNWPCQLSVGHIGPCVSSPENGKGD